MPATCPRHGPLGACMHLVVCGGTLELSAVVLQCVVVCMGHVLQRQRRMCVLEGFWTWNRAPWAAGFLPRL